MQYNPVAILQSDETAPLELRKNPTHCLEPHTQMIRYVPPGHG